MQTKMESCMKGRTPKPAALHALEGTFRPFRHAGNGFDVPCEPPDPPDWLSDAGAAEWSRIVPDLVAAGVVSRIDRNSLAAYCEAWADMIAAMMTIRQEGQVIDCGDGNKKKHPAVTVLNEARAAFLRLTQELGLSPASRMRVRGVRKNEEDDDPFADLETHE
jgi:P27 family predicted phage terminase small subunit